MKQVQSVLVIGAGIGGLAAAIGFARRNDRLAISASGLKLLSRSIRSENCFRVMPSRTQKIRASLFRDPLDDRLASGSTWVPGVSHAGRRRPAQLRWLSIWGVMFDAPYW
ncbi:FAD-binding protein [Sphingobium sp. EM0848]|uniref:FAD-binding protein n=1 Tax=Sphingobium sp. EM0848 TaxID=2743473 RepID=UPI00159CA561|nr:FAD-binding protein [Sphingobium sp. EM0848]